jgi:prevent-host-death family protein
VSALRARANFGQLLRRIEDERRSFVIEKRGTAKAVLIGIRDCVRLAAPEPDVLRVIGEESQRKGTDKLTSRQIDRVIKAARARKPKRARSRCGWSSTPTLLSPQHLNRPACSEPSSCYRQAR